MTGRAGTPSSPEEIFRNSPEGLALFHVVRASLPSDVAVTERATASQIAFRNRRAFAYVWNPRQHLKTRVAAVLSFVLPRRLESPRIKEVVQPSPGLWMHHVELNAAEDVDAEVKTWLREAFDAAA